MTELGAGRRSGGAPSTRRGNYNNERRETPPYSNNEWMDDDDDDDDDMWNNQSLKSSSSSSSSSSRPSRSIGKTEKARYDQGSSKPTRHQQEASGQFKTSDTSSSSSSPSKTPTTSHFFSRKSLQDVSFPSNSPLFMNLCRGAGIERPSKIQSLAWPILLQGKHAIVADQTGSGKTLAYLIPLLLRALEPPQEEEERSPPQQFSSRSKTTPGTPRILVLSPTAELADQTRAVCDKLSQHVAFRTMVVTAQGKFTTSIRDQIRLLQRTNMDVLISTPGRLSTILRTRNAGGLDLSQLSAIVLDEVDVLMVDETFGPQLRTVGAAAPVEETQFVFVTATLPNDIAQTVEREFPGVVQLRGPGLHRVAPVVHERLVDVSVPPSMNRDAEYCFDMKAEQLLKALRETRCRRTLVFCNTVESCRKVENFLKRSDRRGQVLEVLVYHNALTPEVRNENLSLFSKGYHPHHKYEKEAFSSSSSSSSNRQTTTTTDFVLVCTDRAARGVDFDAAPVDHVVIFDFPKDPAEYIRRVGRTARAGRAGTSTVFAFGWQLPIARQVMGKASLDPFDSNRNDPNDDDDDDDDDGSPEEYKSRSAVTTTTTTSSSNKRKKPKRNDKDVMIKGNIEEKRFWI
ncbi:hypothetical protein ACA910_014479 [Epithemia clementina (nom. ined.)]